MKTKAKLDPGAGCSRHVETIVEEAGRIAGKARSRDYGDPLVNHERIAAMWSVQLGNKLTAPITAREVALMMMGLKLAREVNTPKRDNLVDIVGYAICLDQMEPNYGRMQNAEISQSEGEVVLPHREDCKTRKLQKGEEFI